MSSLHWRQPSDEQPGPPLSGIPPQRTPGWIRKTLKILIYPFMALDLFAQKIIQLISPPPYRIEGTCKQRGNCCHYILLGWPEIMDKIPWLGKFWLWWFTDIHGFYLRGFDVENEHSHVARVMSCRYLQPDGRCSEYRLRPTICRQWPRVDYSQRPAILKGCGFAAVPQYQTTDTTDTTEPAQTTDTTETSNTKPK